MSSGGFGRWYEEKKQEEIGDGAAASGGWGLPMMGSEALLPLFNTESMPHISWASMKQSMESQMPKKILGMGYQQRFKVRLL
jgi:hypothetical protein